MALGPRYCKQLREELRRHANFPPNRPIALGDYGVIRDDVFERLGNLRHFGITFDAVDGTGQSSFQYKSKGNVDFNLVAKGDITAGVPAVKAGLDLKFSSENAVFFVAVGCTVKAIDDLLAIQSSLVALMNQGKWESSFYVVTELNIATKTTAIASSDRNCEIKLEAKSPALEAIQLADASLELQVKRSRNTSLEIVTENNQIPLMQLSRLRGVFRPGLRPESVASESLSPFALAPDDDTLPLSEPETMLESAPAVSTAEAASQDFVRFTLEAVVSDFEVQRAITAYIPLMRACYDFAHGNEHPDLPTGFEIIAPIRASQNEAVLESVEVARPDVRAALDNDFRALDQESGKADDARGLEGIASPDAFGFVFREIHTGAVLVGIRGTQTPEEWVKNFTAIPNSFGDVPGFGLIHLGFEQMWDRIRTSVFDGLKGVPRTTRVTFLGHSLGGAMATLGTVDVKKNLNRPNVDLCTFGSPRVGKVIFRVKFNNFIDRCFRVTERRDIVPHVPSLITAWNHVGTQIEVRSQVSNPHSLDSYLEGLRGIGIPQELSLSGVSDAEAVASSRIIAARTL